MDDKALHFLPHLSTISIDEMIKDIGLYSPILINTHSDVACIKYGSSDKKVLPITSDVKQLYSLVFFDEPVSLPCAFCKKELAYAKYKEPFNPLGQYEKPILISLNRRPDKPGASSNPKEYVFGSDTLLTNPKATESDCRVVATTCKDALLYNLQYFSLRLSCTLKQEHEITCHFSLVPFEISKDVTECYLNYWKKCLSAEMENQTPPAPTDAEIEATDLYRIAEHTLVLKKVGQYPSIADLQFFHLKKYQKLLKNSYLELTKAVGLHSAGVGIGSFVYLRRIFESMCEEAHQKCIAVEGWNEQEYSDKRFNEKLEYLAEFGQSILPDELTPIKTKLYGVLSKGVHEYTETECQELFPSLQMAIELLLDNKLSLLERQNKIKAMEKAISSAKT